MAEFVKLDLDDLAILEELQRDARVTTEALAETCALSKNSAWRRVKRLEEAGVIRRRAAVIDPEAIGFALTAFVSVKTSDHSAAWLEDFHKAADHIPEITEFYRLAGEIDYLIKLALRSVADYDRVYKQLIAVAPMADVSAAFAMERIIEDRGLPVATLRREAQWAR